jgi:hypothetical protein
MSSHDDSPNYRFRLAVERWLAVERPAILNRAAYYRDLVENPRIDVPFMTPGRSLRARLYNHRMRDLADDHLALGDRLHELRRRLQTLRLTTRALPSALAVVSELWLAELDTVAAQYAALGPIGADPGPPGPLRMDEYLLLFV